MDERRLIRKLTLDALLENILPYMSHAYGLSEVELRQDARLRLVLGELQERIKKLSDAPEYVDFLYRVPVLSSCRPDPGQDYTRTGNPGPDRRCCRPRPARPLA